MLRRGSNHAHAPPGHVSVSTAQDALALLCCQEILLAHAQPAIYEPLQVLLSKAAPKLVRSQPVSSQLFSSLISSISLMRVHSVHLLQVTDKDVKQVPGKTLVVFYSFLEYNPLTATFFAQSSNQVFYPYGRPQIQTITSQPAYKNTVGSNVEKSSKVEVNDLHCFSIIHKVFFL